MFLNKRFGMASAVGCGRYLIVVSFVCMYVYISQLKNMLDLQLKIKYN